MSLEDKISRLEDDLARWEIGLDALWVKWRQIQVEFEKVEDAAGEVLDVNEWERVDNLRQRLNGALELLARFVE